MKILIIFSAVFALVCLANVSGEGIAGRIRRVEGEEIASKQKELANSLSIFAAGDGPYYTIDKVYAASTQQIYGPMNRFDVDLIDNKTGEKTRCIVSIWSQEWLTKDGVEVTFECKDKEQFIKHHDRVENENSEHQ